MHDASRALASRDSYASVGAGGKQMRKMHVMAGGDQSKGEKQSGYVGFPAQQTGRLQTSGLLSRSSGDQKSEIEVWAGACSPEAGGGRGLPRLLQLPGACWPSMAPRLAFTPALQRHQAFSLCVLPLGTSGSVSEFHSGFGPVL